MTTNAELHQRRVAAVPRGVANSLPVYADRASNAELWDVEGKRYVDKGLKYSAPKGLICCNRRSTSSCAPQIGSAGMS